MHWFFLVFCAPYLSLNYTVYISVVVSFSAVEVYHFKTIPSSVVFQLCSLNLACYLLGQLMLKLTIPFLYESRYMHC
jgi:hypothetical protein